MNPVNNPKNKEMHGKIRKLSMSILLNNPNEYEGEIGRATLNSSHP